MFYTDQLDECIQALYPHTSMFGNLRPWLHLNCTMDEALSWLNTFVPPKLSFAFGLLPLACGGVDFFGGDFRFIGWRCLGIFVGIFVESVLSLDTVFPMKKSVKKKKKKIEKERKKKKKTTEWKRKNRSVTSNSCVILLLLPGFCAKWVVELKRESSLVRNTRWL